MIVIYHDIGGTHSTCVAANIHINRLPADTVPDKDEILSLPTFDKVQKKDRGHLFYIGEDEFGAKVYTIGRQREAKLVVPALMDMYKILNGSMEGLYIVNTSPTVNLLMAIGGFTSRVLNLAAIGRPIVTYGTLKGYMEIAKLVKEVKQRIKEDVGINRGI